MPFFVCVSGYSFYHLYLKNRNDNTNIYKLTKIYLVFGTAIILAKVAFSAHTVDKISPSDILSNFLLPDTFMWYIWFLILMSSFSILIANSHFSKNIHRFGMIFFTLMAICIGGPLNNSQFPIGLQHLSSLPLFYGLGIHFATQRTNSAFKSSPFFTLSSLAVAVSYIIYLQFYENYPSHYLPLHTLFRYSNGLAMTYLLFSNLVRLEDKWPSLLAWFGRYSIYFYLIHTYILTIFTLFIKKYFLSAPIVLLVSISFFILLVTNSLVIFFIKKIPQLDKLFLGNW